ncbi:MAG: hypothetical protein LC116_00985 [Bacteroidetes bacterium]|nr:hypothetical protein [Bacteroidota bacterium]MCZ2131761.1 hypothetical protein [Bacteroidota bacterium]
MYVISVLHTRFIRYFSNLRNKYVNTAVPDNDLLYITLRICYLTLCSVSALTALNACDLPHTPIVPTMLYIRGES